MVTTWTLALSNRLASSPAFGRRAESVVLPGDKEHIARDVSGPLRRVEGAEQARTRPKGVDTVVSRSTASS
jgi:hypothetical protein